MSADFDDLVARVRRVALDEAYAAHGCASTGACYPQPHQVAEAQANVLMRLWETIMAAPAGGPYRAPGSAPYYTIELPEGGEYLASVRPGGFVFESVPGNCLEVVEVPTTARDPIHDAITSMSRPRRAHE